METFTHLASNKDSIWNRTEKYVKQERQIKAIRKISVYGAVDVVFLRSDTPMLVVAGETAEIVAAVKTYFKNDVLFIEREGIKINIGNGQMTFNGSIGSFITGDIVNGKAPGPAVRQSKAVVGITLPQAPALCIEGSGNANFLDLEQPALTVKVVGSGNITAGGHVESLDVQISGSGQFNAEKLVSNRARLSVVGSGEINALVRLEVYASVAGSGDILIHGNPQYQDQSVSGRGEIRFS